MEQSHRAMLGSIIISLTDIIIDGIDVDVVEDCVTSLTNIRGSVEDAEDHDKLQNIISPLSNLNEDMDDDAITAYCKQAITDLVEYLVELK